MEAVGVGYVFNLFDEGDLPGVDLRETGEYVRVDGSLPPHEGRDLRAVADGRRGARHSRRTAG